MVVRPVISPVIAEVISPVIAQIITPIIAPIVMLMISLPLVLASGCGNDANEANRLQIEHNQALLEKQQRELAMIQAQPGYTPPPSIPGQPGSNKALQENMDEEPILRIAAPFPVLCRALLCLLTTVGGFLHKRVDGFAVILKQLRARCSVPNFLLGDTPDGEQETFK